MRSARFSLRSVSCASRAFVQKRGSPVVLSSSSFSFAAFWTSKIAPEGAHGRREFEQALNAFFVHVGLPLGG
jgi:hypothetical protein